MIEYVVGFLFSEKMRGGDWFNSQVVLIRKNRPAGQRHYLNGVGGHIEAGESPYQAMVREFEEETGKVVTDWEHTVTLTNDERKVFFFRAYGDVHSVEQRTDERLETPAMAGAMNEQVLPNLRWLLPLCADRTGVQFPIEIQDAVTRT